MGRLRLAVIGVGHLGKEHARILSALPDAELVGVADTDREQAESVARRHGTRAYADHRPLLDAVDAAVLVVPTTHHHAVAREFLGRGIPLLVEKPLALGREQADDLVAAARRHGALLQVGHIERFNPAFEHLQRLPLRPLYVTCERYSPFAGRSTDIGAVLDLMIHDLELLLALVRSPVTGVTALGVTVLGGHEDMATATLTFANGCVAHLTASRVHPGPRRRLNVWGPEGIAGLDLAARKVTLVQPSELLRSGVVDSRRLDPALLASLKAELFTRHLPVQEIDCNHGDQLTRELQDFLRCVRTGQEPRVSGEQGRDALALAERVLDGIRTHGWDGDTCVGPANLPAPRGPLFSPENGKAAA